MTTGGGTSGDSEENLFDLSCAECSRPIRWSRRQMTAAGELDFYADEDDMEARDFHFHLPNR